MSKFKKHQKKGQSSIQLQDAVLQYALKNYAGALKRLKSADLKSGEEQKAKNLEYAITFRLALTDINDSNYSSALKYLLPLTPSDARACAYAGIAYLYLLDYKAAIPLLKKAIVNYPSFSFYHLLAELYLQKDVDFEGFVEFFKNEWQHCTEAQQQYIRLIASCFEGNTEIAIETAKSLKSQSHFQHLNFEAFKHILTQPPPTKGNGKLSIESGLEKLKPLYRLINGAHLLDSEKSYFQSYESNIPNLSSLLKNQNNITAHLQEELEAQYHENKFLNEGTLTAIMQAAPEEQRPYIAYNQAVNALDQEYFEDAEKGIKHIIVKYADDFVKIPESLPVYFHIYKDEDTKAYPATFWQFVNKWLAIRNNNLSVENLDAMGWELFNIVFRQPALIDTGFRHELEKIYKAYPSVFAIKFAQILFPNKTLFNNPLNDSCLDLFSLPNADKHKAKFVEQLNTFISILSPYQNSFIFDMLEERAPKEIFIAQIPFYATCFMTAVTRYTIPPQNTIALESFKLIHHYIKEIISHNDKLPKGFYEKFKEVYTGLIKQFEKHPDIPIYQRDLTSGENAKYAHEFKDLIRYNVHSAGFTRYLKSNLDIKDYSFAWEEFMALIDRTHFEDTVAECLVEFIEALYVFQKNDLATKKEIDIFIRLYRQKIKDVACEHPTTFYGEMIQLITKKKALSDSIIHYFSIQFIEQLTLKFELETKQYNAVIAFFEFIIAKKYASKPDYDSVLVKKLKKYLIDINKTKRLKKIDTLMSKIVMLP
jgi:hypothetical protein